LAHDAFDEGATEAEIVAAARALPTPVLVLVPALFGAAPWLDANLLALALDRHAFVVVDAAQTAFGALDVSCPVGGGVLSCPRKSLAISDGALLRLATTSAVEHDSVLALPEASEAARLKTQARHLFASGREEDEDAAVCANVAAELALPAEPHRMSVPALAQLRTIDRRRHVSRRIANAAALASALGPEIVSVRGPGGVPFDHPILVRNRHAVLQRLHARRLFATALWPEARLDPRRHPRAARLAREVIALPVDQRHGPGDMESIAAIVRATLNECQSN
jgi:dTDP-4-amino-4,6-dideoxygalactose transaminase